MVGNKILLTGATGYVGGTVLHTLLSSQEPAIQNASISVLVRGDYQARVLHGKGVPTIQFGGFDDEDTLTRAASEHDVVINTASGFDAGFATALIRGLEAKRKALGPVGEVHYIHTSGTTNLADSPALNLYPTHTPGIISDTQPAEVLSTLRALNSSTAYAQRGTDLAVLDLGQKTGIKTHSIYLPMLFGLGTGYFRKVSGQVPILMREAQRAGHAWIIGDGSGVKQHVHIEDAADLYVLVLRRVLEESPVPFGEEGIIFVENGEHSWKAVGEEMAVTGKRLGVLGSEEVKSLSLEEGGKVLGAHDMQYVEAAFVSSARVSADMARSLGWQPRWSNKSFWEYFEEAWRIVLEDP